MKKAILFIILIIAYFALSSSTFIVYEGQYAYKTRFGKADNEILNPGLHFKVPLIDDIVIVDSRIQIWDGDPTQIPTKDKRYIYVDTTARWKIKNPQLFVTQVGSIRGAQSRLDDIIDSTVRDEVSSSYLDDLVRGQDYIPPKDQISNNEQDSNAPASHSDHKSRDNIINELYIKAKESIQVYGIELVDIQIRRIKYIETVCAKVYERMTAERNKIAAGYKAEGEGRAAEIRGEMQRELKRINSEASRQAAEIRGRADAEAAAVYANAYSSDPEFYAFYRSMQGLERIVNQRNKFILSTDSEIFKYLNGTK